METNSPVKAVVTVAEMARMCRLSRSRFYTLVKDGIMPPASINPETSRPFYSREQQEQCLRVRQTNCGVNGRPVLFYCPRPETVVLPKAKAARKATKPKRQASALARGSVDQTMTDLLDGLGQLGMPNVAEDRVRTALAASFPDGHAELALPTILMTVFRWLRQNGEPGAART